MTTSIPRDPEDHRIPGAYIIFTMYMVQKNKHQHCIYHSCKHWTVFSKSSKRLSTKILNEILK